MVMRDNAELRDELIRILKGEKMPDRNKLFIKPATKEEIEEGIVENYAAFKSIAKTARVCTRYFGTPIGVERVKNTLRRKNVKIVLPKNIEYYPSIYNVERS